MRISGEFVPLSPRERADERLYRSRGEGKRAIIDMRPNPLTPRMSTCVGPLPGGEGKDLSP